MLDTDQKVLTFRDVLRNREFLALYLSETQSVLGDQVARVCLALLVFDQTGSAAVTALTYALTYLPAVVGGVVLSPVADRYNRRTVMIVCDIVRALLLFAVGIHGMPIGLLCLLVGASVLLSPVFRAAQLATISEIFTADGYRIAIGLRLMTGQIVQLVGFGVGGTLAGVLGVRHGLLIDSASFAVSALVIALTVRSRDRGGRAADKPGERHSGSALSTVRLMLSERRLRALLMLSAMVGFYVTPEGLAAPYAAALGDGSVTVGMLMAALPLGSAVGAFVVLRMLPARSRSTLLGVSAVLAGLPLALCVTRPGLAISLVLWALCGVFTAYQVDASTMFLQTFPDEHRGRASGLYTSGLLGAQGIAVVTFGFIADNLGAAHAIALAGGLGSLLALGPAIVFVRLSTPRGRHHRATDSTRKVDSHRRRTARKTL